MVPSELTVFEENYALLCNTITDIVDPLMEFLLKEKMFADQIKKETVAVTASSEQLKYLLLIISHSLNANGTRCFYMMVKIMKEHGGKETQTLADHIMNRLEILPDKLFEICSDDVYARNDTIKGFLLNIS